jgi:hypothetical protein
MADSRLITLSEGFFQEGAPRSAGQFTLPTGNQGILVGDIVYVGYCVQRNGKPHLLHHGFNYAFERGGTHLIIPAMEETYDHYGKAALEGKPLVLLNDGRTFAFQSQFSPSGMIE